MAAFVVGILNSAAPFCLFAYAEITLSAGVTSVINATTPLWGAIVAFFWLKDRLTGLRVAGLAIGFVGVVALVWNQMGGGTSTGVPVTPAATALAAAAALGATLLYGISASYTKRNLTGVDSLAVATGTMTAATVVLLPFAVFWWPATAVSAQSWEAAIALGVACTGIAYMLFFSLIASTGPARTISVTFVIPIFGILWGALFLSEHVSPGMIKACATILVGTALATGVIKRLPGMGARRNAPVK
jgi:drug/metabolite transporter (DMT)-like permease